MSEMLIVEQLGEVPFTMVSKRCLNDPRLSLQAKGVYCLLVGNPPGWRINMKELMSRSTNGQCATYSALGELESLGYIRRERRSQNGRFTETALYVNVNPQPPFPDKPETVDSPCLENRNTIAPCPEKPYMENPDMENPAHSNKDLSKKDVSKNEGEQIPPPPLSVPRPIPRPIPAPSPSNRDALTECIKQIPEIWNLAAEQFGMRKCYASREAAIRKLWKDSALFREHWRDIGTIFGSNPFNCGQCRPRPGEEPHKADLDYALRRSSAAKPWTVFDREYEKYREAVAAKTAGESTEKVF